MRIIKSRLVFSIILSVICLFLEKCNSARIPLQVDITKMAQCDDSKRAGNGDKVSKMEIKHTFEKLNFCNSYEI